MALQRYKKWRLPAALLSIAILSGCAMLSSDAGFSGVQSAAKERGLKQDAKWLRNEQDQEAARASVRKMLKAPLTADSAVQIALLNNPGLQATYADVGIAEADVVQAGRLRNPGFSYARLRRGDEIEIERTFLFDVLGLITMPIRTELEKRRHEITKSRVAAEILQVATDTRRAWHRAVSRRPEISASSIRRASRCSMPKRRRSLRVRAKRRYPNANGSPA